MVGPGAYRPDPTEGMPAIADLPAPEIVPSRRNDKRQPCPRCGHSAYRDKQFQRTLHDLGNLGYLLKAGQLEYDCRYSTMHGMPVTGGRGFRSLKPLWYNSVPP